MSTLLGLDTTLTAIREAKALREAQRDEMLAEVASLTGEIRRLEAAEQALTGSVNGNGNGSRARTDGPNSIDLAEAFMREVRIATQSEVAKALDRPKNTAKHALKVLTTRGVIAPTGVIERRSPQYALVDDGS